MNNGQNELSKMRVQIARLKNSMNGVRTRPGPDPPSIVVNPFNSVVVVMRPDSSATSFEIAWNDIVDTLKLQIKLTGLTSTVQMKIKEIKSWGLVGGGSSSLGDFSAEFFDFLQDTEHSLCSITDAASGQNRPRAGYVFPERLSNVVASGLTSKVAAFGNISGGSSAAGASDFFQGGEVHVHILWRIL